MPTITTGEYRATGATLGVTSNIIKLDVIDRIFYEDADLAPLTLFMRRMKKEVAKSFKYEWIEKQEMPQVDQVNNAGGYTAGAVSVVVDNGGYFFVNSLAVVQRTGEVLHVTGVSTNTLTVVRSWGGTAAAALNDNDYLSIIGGAALEGAEAELPRAVKAAAAHNFTQIWRDGFGITETLNHTDLYGGKDIDNLQAEAGRRHKKYMEMAWFYGERNADTSGDEPRRSAGGMKEFISTNSTDFSGIVTLEEIQTASESDFRYGAKTKLLYVPYAGASNISLVAKDHITTSKAPPSETFGLRISRLRAQQGDYLIFAHPLFEGNEVAKRGFVIDPANVAYVPLQGRDTMLKRDIQAPSADAVEHEWLTEATMRRTLERTHSIWDNVA